MNALQPIMATPLFAILLVIYHVELTVSRDTRVPTICTKNVAEQLGVWIGHKNATHWQTGFRPYGVQLRPSVEDLEDNRDIPLAGSTDCFTPESNGLGGVPLCPYHWKLNFDPMRLPSELPEVHCNCLTNEEVTCERLYMWVKVLRWSPACKLATEAEEKISVACVPVNHPSQRISRTNGLSLMDRVKVVVKKQQRDN